MSDEGEIFRFEIPGYAGDSLEMYVYDGELYIEIDSPWAGDSTTGFGANLGVKLPKDLALTLAEWIARRLA